MVALTAPPGAARAMDPVPASAGKALAEFMDKQGVPWKEGSSSTDVLLREWVARMCEVEADLSWC